jgi:hypothetical protein
VKLVFLRQTLHVQASAVGGFVLLGLLQPQRWLQQLQQQPLDTSLHTVAIIIPVSWTDKCVQPVFPSFKSPL